jgi:hypothetical protein
MVECQIISHKEKKADLISPFYMKGEKPNYE